MKPLHKGIAFAAIHILIVCSLGAKLLIDRAHYPRVWVKAAAYDPNLPIRGRYASMQLLVNAPEAKVESTIKGENGKLYSYMRQRARLEVRDGQLVAVNDDFGSVSYERRWNLADQPIVLSEPVAFFINEKIKDPTIRARDEELWVEVTVPRRGPPRPIRLAVKMNGIMQPLDLD
jgi:hypothetical protein